MPSHPHLLYTLWYPLGRYGSHGKLYLPRVRTKLDYKAHPAPDGSVPPPLPLRGCLGDLPCRACRSPCPRRGRLRAAIRVRGDIDAVDQRPVDPLLQARGRVAVAGLSLGCGPPKKRHSCSGRQGCAYRR